MNVVLLLVPALAAVAFTLAARAVPRRLDPRTATLILVVSATAAAAAFVGAIALIALGFITQYTPLSGVCRAVTATHDRVPVWLGAPAVAAIGLIVMSAARAHRQLRMLDGPPSGRDLEVVAIPEPTAYAVPGRPGHVVVSVGMLKALPADERRVLLAHERSHLDNDHHRYLRLMELAAAAAPVMSPLRCQVRQATERWADEDAAVEVGDRRLVARAIAHAALAEAEYGRAGPLRMTGGGVPARLEALLAGPTSRAMVLWASIVAGGTLVTAVATSTVQLHHLWAFAAHVCPV